jgi:hypothetical protein
MELNLYRFSYDSVHPSRLLGQNASPKRWLLPASPHGIQTQKNIINISLWTSLPRHKQQFLLHTQLTNTGGYASTILFCEDTVSSCLPNKQQLCLHTYHM